MFGIHHFLCLTLAVFANASASSPAQSQAASQVTKPEASPAKPGDLPDSSLYQLPSVWKTDAGHPLRLRKLSGKPRLLTLFFGHCQSSCPMVLSSLKSLAAALPAGWSGQGGIVLVTLDPQHDGTDSLAAFRKRMEMDTLGWTLLQGSETDTRALAMAIGVGYRKSAKNGGIEHDAVVVLLDAQGRIRARHEGAPETKLMLQEFQAAMATQSR